MSKYKAGEPFALCTFSMCSTKRGITKAQESAGGHWLCPEHRSKRDVDVSDGWGFVNSLEVEK